MQSIRTSRARFRGPTRREASVTEYMKGDTIMVRSQNKSWISFVLLLALLTVFATGCRVRQTEEGEMPDVDVSTEGGKMPEYDVDAADVDVKTEKREITVPD